MDHETSVFDEIFGFHGDERVTPPKLELPAPQVSLDPLDAFKERAEFIGAGIALGLTAERAESDYDNARITVKAPEIQFAKRAPNSKLRIEKTPTGATIVRDEKGEIVGFYSAGTEIPEEMLQ